MRVPGSTVQFTAGDIAHWSVVSDWFPNEHPAMPAVVATSHSAQLPACAYCHLPDGSGRPENAKTAGLSADEIAAAAEYLSHQAVKSFVRVIESAKVPNHRSACFTYTPSAGRAEPCSLCHGADLRGGKTLPGPPLAGRFPGYLFRQLYGFQTGARAGEAAQAMQPIVARLTQTDMIDLAAYAASLQSPEQASA